MMNKHPNRQKILNEFLKKVLPIERELDALYSFADNIPQLYNGNTFPEQEELSADILENLIIAATHETASQIGFYRNTIETLARFIEFREKYSDFSDNELEAILNGNLSPELKQNLFKRSDTTLVRMNEAIQGWNRTFENKDYAKVKKQFQNQIHP